MRIAIADSRYRTLLIVAFALAVLFLRRPDAFLTPQFWAEDFVFLLQAEKSGLATLWAPSSGYLILIPRAIAWLASHLDPLLQPAFYLLGWLTALATVLATCLSPRLELPAKGWLAAAVVLVPHSGEVFFNPTNVQWIAALGLVLTVLKRDPVRPREWAADVGTLVGTGLSGPFAIFASPFFAWRAAQRKSVASTTLFALNGVLAAIQLWFIAHSPPDREFTGPFNPTMLLANVCFRLSCSEFFGVLVPAARGPALVIAAGLAMLSGIGVAVWRAGRHRAGLLALLGFAGGLLVASAARKRFDLWGFGDLANGDRYFFVPKVILLWIVGLSFATARARWGKGVALALIGCSLVTNAPRFRFAPCPDRHWYERCAEIRAGREVEVTINPGWKFRYQRGSPDSAGPIF